MSEVLKILIGIFITGAVLISGCLQEIKNEPYEETAYNEAVYNYSTPGFEIDQKQASTVWEKVKFSDDAKFVTREKNYSVTVFVQSYTRVPAAHSPYDISTSEWIVVASSIPKKKEDIKIAIFRLDYQTFDFKRSYYFSYPQRKELTLKQSIAVMEEELKKEPGGFQSINESAVVLQDGNYIYSYLAPDIGETMYLFSWDEIPGNGNGRLIYFLHREHRLDLLRDTKIEKIDNNRTIRVTGGENTVLLKLSDEKTKVNLEIDDGRTAELIANMENGKLNIYGATTDKGSTIILNKYAGRIIFHAIFRAGKDIWIKDTSLRERVSGSFIIPGEEVNGTALLPRIETRVESIRSPAYRGTSTLVKLSFIARNNISNGGDIYVNYKTEILHTNGSLFYEPEGFEIIPEKKRLIFPGGGDEQQVVYSNLTINTSNAAAEGDYIITITIKYKGWVVGSNMLYFKIGKGGKKSPPGGESIIENTWNIGYSADQPPLLNETEKAEILTIAINDTYLKDKRYEITGITSEYLNLENFSGFFAVVTVDVGDPDFPGEIIRYIIDREEKKVFTSVVTPRPALEYFRGEAFDEAKGNFTKSWDAENFPGFWLDPEANVSTETLIIDQSLLNNSYRVIDKHSLIYVTNPVPFKYQVYAQANQTPDGTDGFYQAIVWLGEKHVYLQGNRLAKIIFEQNATEEKEMTIGESWELGEGYRVIANSISAKDTGGRQAWITLFKDSNKLVDTVMVQQYGPNKFFTYRMNLSDSTLNFMVYYSRVDSLQYTDAAYFKYTWLRSQNITEIKEGDTFGIMEVTSIDNGKIELSNREPIDLAPGKRIHIMGNISIQVGSSEDRLQFHPFRVRKP